MLNELHLVELFFKRHPVWNFGSNLTEKLEFTVLNIQLIDDDDMTQRPRNNIGRCMADGGS